MNNKPVNIINNGVIKGKNIPFNGHSIGIVPHFNGIQVPSHAHDFYEILYVYKGSCFTAVDGESLFLKKGDFILFNMFASHSVMSSSDSENEIFNILLKRKIVFNPLLKDLLQKTNYAFNFSFFEDNTNGRRNYLCVRNSKNNFSELFLRLILINSADDDCFQEKEYVNLFTSFIIELVRYKRNSSLLLPPYEKPKYEEIRQYILDHCDCITLTQLAKHFNCNSCSISSLLEHKTGKKFSKLLQDIRLTKAASLLQETSLPVYDISFFIGYSNRSFFVRKFKEMYGFPPSVWRQKIRA